MEGHTIRLRGGWDCLRPEQPTIDPVPVVLPTSSNAMPGGRLLLRRRFGRPPREPEASAVLRISGMPGLRSLTFNGRPIEVDSPASSDFETDLGPLQPRNELTIEAQPPPNAADWGDVRLVLGKEPESESPSA